MVRIFVSIISIISASIGIGYAAVNGPYAANAETLHLYHFDGDVNDAVAGNPIDLALAYGATVTETSYSDFGTAINTYDGTGANNVNLPIAYTDEKAISNFVGSDGAFTFEAIIRPDVSITAIPNNMQIICGEDDGSETRGWQFRVSTAGQLSFLYLMGTTSTYNFTIPVTGDHAWAVGQWFHAAVTYNGQENTPDNLKLYWTRLDSGASEAALLGSFQMTYDLVASEAIDFSIGNDARDTYGASENFEGLLDEVRISSIACQSNDMLFLAGLPPAVIISQPSDVTVSEPQTAVFETVFESDSAPQVQWFKADPAGDIELLDSDPDIIIDISYDSQNLRYTTTLTLSNTSVADSGDYYCRIRNDSGIWRTSNWANLLVQGLIARWTLDEADFVSGHYLDSISGYDANAVGTPTFVTGADGTINGAALMTPAGGRAAVENFNPGQTAQLTLSLWVNWQETSVPSDDLWALESLYNYLLNVENGLKADNNWQQICIVLNDSTGKLYINGRLETQGPWSLPEDLTSLLNIGAKNDGSEIFNGAMDNIRIYNFAMTDTEVADVYYAVTHTGVCVLEYASVYDVTGPQNRPDCTVDLYDLLVFANQWLVQYAYPEFAEFSGEWLSCTLYPNCTE